MRQTLIDAYLDYVNNYLTVSKYAEHNGLTFEQGKALLTLGAELYYTNHPES